MAPVLRYDVFVSYAQQDLGFVRELVTVLEDNGFQPFWDRGAIKSGLSWPSEIEEVLSKVLPAVIVLSPDAMKSMWVQREKDVLLVKGGLIIPLMVRDCQPFPFIEVLQRIDFRDSSKWGDSFAALISRLRPEAAEIKLRAIVEWPGRWRMPMHRLLAAFLLASVGTLGKIVERPRRWRVSVRRLLALCLLASVGSVLSASLLVSGWRTYHLKRIRDLQREVQAIDEGRSGERSDVWQQDQLLFRRLSSHGRVVAQDEFAYEVSGRAPVRKVRSYLNEDRSIFLVDEFAQDGLLLKKRYCPEGPERPCDVYIDDMRSPMPPPTLFLYR